MNNYPSGAVTLLQNSQSNIVVSDNEEYVHYARYEFLASKNSLGYNNPMEGHTESEIKPYSIFCVPIYIY